MGLKHLRTIESWFRSNAKFSFSTRKIRTKFGYNPDIVRECLAYLLEQKKIKLIKGRWDKYQWKNATNN